MHEVVRSTRCAPGKRSRRRPSARLVKGPSPATAAAAKAGYEYERVVRYNYSRNELSVLVDALSLVKQLASMLKSAARR